MGEYIQDIMNLKCLGAHINFFKLLNIGQLTKKDYNNFCLIDGKEKVNKLLDDINQRNIELFFDNGDAKNISTLYYEMINLCQELQSVKVSTNNIFKRYFEEVYRISSYYNKNFIEDEVLADLTLLTFLPIEVAEMIDVRQTILTRPSKQKKLGER